MGKNKGSKGKTSATPVVATPAKSLNAVKDGRVTKPAQSTKSKAKELAKTAMTKASKKPKEPTPSSESESESEASSVDSEEESEVEEAKPTETKVNGAKRINGVSKAKNSDSSDSDSSESESEDEVHVPAPKANGVKAAAVTNGANLSNSDDEDSEASSESDEETPAKSKVVAKKAELSSDEESDGSDDSEDGSEDGSDDDSEDSDASEESVAEVKQNKRKAEEETASTFKKAKTVSADVGKNGESKNLFVGNLSFGIDEDGLHSEFKEFGEVTGCRVVYDRDSGRSKGFGYVEFASIEAAMAAHGAKNGALLDGRALNVDYSQPRTQTPRDKNVNGFSSDRAKRFGDTQSPASDTVFVGNISFDATNEMVQEAFESFGTITRVSLPTDMESGALKGFGYVGFSSIDEAKAAVESLNGTEIAGRNIRLDFAQPRPDRDGGGGGFRGRGRGGPRGGGGFRGRGGNDRGGRGGGRGSGGFRGGRGASTNRGGFGDFQGKKMTF